MSSLTSTANGYFQVVTPTPSGPGGAALNANFEQADAELEAIYGALADKADASDLSELTFAGLADTRITSPTLGDVLAYVPAFSSWANVKPDAAGLATTAVLNSGLANLIPRGHISGLTLSNNTADPNNDLDIAAGEAVDESRSYLMRLAAPITKRLDAAWSAGSGNGGLFSGTKQPNTWYHVFLIRRDSDGALDVGFDTSVTAANKPVGWSAYRRIGARLTDVSGNFKRCVQYGDLCLWSDLTTDFQGAGADAFTLYTLSIPPIAGVMARVTVLVQDEAQFSIVTYRVPGSAEPIGPSIIRYAPAMGTNQRAMAELPSDGQSRVEMRVQNSSSLFHIQTHGWIDTRGRG